MEKLDNNAINFDPTKDYKAEVMEAASPAELDARYMGTETGSGSLEQVKASLEANMQRLDRNINDLDAVSKSDAAITQDGKEITKSLLSNTKDIFTSFAKSALEKVKSMEGWGFESKAEKCMLGTVMAITVTPALVQLVRTYSPEVGAAFDAAPEVLQNLIHTNIALDFVNHFSSDQLGWAANTQEQTQVFAGLANGTITMDTITDTQKEVLNIAGKADELYQFLSDPSSKEVFSSKTNLEFLQEHARSQVVVPATWNGVSNGIVATLAGSTLLEVARSIGRVAGKVLNNKNLYA